MPNQKKPESILVIDSDTLAAQDIALLIAKLGYGIAGIAHSAEEAPAKIAPLKPDLLLINLMLVNSVDTVRAIRHIQFTANIPVILYSDNPEHALIATTLTDVPFTWLQSPLKERELQLQLELALLRHNIEKQNRQTHQALNRRIIEITHELDSTNHNILQELQTQQRRDQASLRRFSDALDDSADSIYLIDRISMRFIDMNKIASESLGYSRDELLQMGPHDIKPYFSRHELENEFDRISATQDRFGVIDTCHQRKNNEIYPVEVRLRASEADGRVIFVAIARDLTLRTKNEQALRLSEEKFRRLFDFSLIGMALMSHDYSFTDVNPAFCRMLGYRREELLDKNMRDITHQDDMSSSLEIADQLFSAAMTDRIVEIKYLHKSGEPIWGRMHGTLIRDQNQHPLFGLGMIENIDHIKKAEAIRMAQESAQKKALVREVHHRIKNHLQGIVGLMQQHALNKKANSDIIQLAITQINAVSTIHGMQGKQANEDVDILQLLIAISHGLTVFISARNILPVKVTGNVALYLNREESVPFVLALNELMINASKHGSSPMKISLNCRNDEAVIHIENNICKAMEKMLPGSGLELVHALLQTQGITFKYEYNSYRFLVEIVLTPPVIQLHRNTE